MAEMYILKSPLGDSDTQPRCRTESQSWGKTENNVNFTEVKQKQQNTYHDQQF